MKSICILQDAKGNLCVHFTRNANLKRREMSGDSGPAHLVWHCLAPPHTPADQIITRLEALLPHETGRFPVGQPDWRFHARVARITIIDPLVCWAVLSVMRRFTKPIKRGTWVVRRRIRPGSLFAGRRS